MPTPLIDPAALEPLLDNFFTEQMQTLSLPGAVFVLVQDGRILFTKGYGVANRLLEIPYDPVETIVHGGSLIKVIIATAVMQLQEQGKVDLHTDVNQYLRDFQVPNTFTDPITLHHLLHHTSGLDAKFNSTRTYSVDQLEPLGYYLAHALPPRVMPPGEIRNYNDFGIALAAQVVQDASGVPLDQFLWGHLFQPLAMHSTMMLVPEADLPRLAIGYTLKQGEFNPNLIGNYLLQTGPGAAFNTTAQDIAHFMIAHLQNGRFHDKQILQPDTMREMHTTQFRHHPQLPGMAFAFDEVFMNGRRLLAKSGGAPGTNNRLVLLPDEGAGYFVSYNRFDAKLHTRLTQLLLDTYFPDAQDKKKDRPVAMDLTPYAGTYREINNYSATTFEKVITLANQFKVSVNQDNTLSLFNSQLTPVAENLFQGTNTGAYIAAGADSQGKSYLYMARTAYEKLPLWETRPFQFGLLGFSALTFFAVAIAWFSGHDGHAAQLVAALVGTGNLVFLLGLALFLLELNRGGEPPWEIEFGLPTPLLALLAIPLLTTPLAGLMLILTIIGVAQGILTGTAVFINLLLFLGTLAFIFFLRTWNLFGYKV